MAAIIFPKKWTEPPTGPVVIDRGHPLGTDLFTYYLLLGAVKTVPNLAMEGDVAVMQATSVITARGVDTSNAAGTGHLVGTRAANVTCLATFAWRGVSFGSQGAYSAPLNFRGAGIHGILSGANGGTANLGYIWNNDQFDWDSGLAVNNAGTEYTGAIAIHADRAVGFVNGAYAANVEAHTAQQINAVSTVGSDTNNPTVRRWNGTLKYVAAWRRPLLLDEMYWLYAEPYTMLIPQAPRRRYWCVTAAAPSTQPPRSMHQFRQRRVA